MSMPVVEDEITFRYAWYLYGYVIWLIQYKKLQISLTIQITLPDYMTAKELPDYCLSGGVFYGQDEEAIRWLKSRR
jgi:uncharacterized protein (DUF488 family)